MATEQARRAEALRGATEAVEQTTPEVLAALNVDQLQAIASFLQAMISNAQPQEPVSMDSVVRLDDLRHSRDRKEGV